MRGIAGGTRCTGGPGTASPANTPGRHKQKNGPSRWHKMYRRARYVISCNQLGTAQTKDGSYRAANEWWLKTKAEVDGSPPEPPWEGLLNGEVGKTPELRQQIVTWARYNGLDALSA